MSYVCCTNEKMPEKETELQNYLFASWSNNLNYEISNFSITLHYLADHYKTTMTNSEIIQQKGALDAFNQGNRLFVLNQILDGTNVPTEIKDS